MRLTEIIVTIPSIIIAVVSIAIHSSTSCLADIELHCALHAILRIIHVEAPDLNITASRLYRLGKRR